jgi:hypothetical protein
MADALCAAAEVPGRQGHAPTDAAVDVTNGRSWREDARLSFGRVAARWVRNGMEAIQAAAAPLWLDGVDPESHPSTLTKLRALGSSVIDT